MARRVDKAEEEAGRVLKAEVRLDGSFAIKARDGDLVSELTHDAILGAKVALVQSLLGQNKDQRPDCRGEAKHVVLPIAAALGIENAVRRDAKAALEPDEGAVEEVKFDDDPAWETERSAT
jgi:hypothetical protein